MLLLQSFYLTTENVRFIYDWNIKYMQSFQVFQVHRLSLMNGFVFSTSFRTAAEGHHVKFPAQRSVNCKPLVQLLVAKINVPPTTSVLSFGSGDRGWEGKQFQRSSSNIENLKPSALSPPKCPTEIWWWIPRNETATEKKCVRLRSKLAGFARGVGAGVEARREEEGGRRRPSGQGRGALGRREGSQVGRVPTRPWPGSSRQWVDAAL